MVGLYPRSENGCQCGGGFRDYNGPVQHLGAYLIRGKLRQEGPIEVLEGLDPITGGALLFFRPLQGMPPKLNLPAVLPYELPVGDAWLVELPFGVASARGYQGRVSADRLLAWSRRLLGAFAELESRGLRHGKLALSDLWVRGDALWVSGVGVPWPDPEPDAVRLVAVLRELAGDAWLGWPYAEALESLADGRRSYVEVLRLLEGPDRQAKDSEPLPPSEAEPPPTVRVKGVKATPAEGAKSAPAPKEPDPLPSGRGTAEVVRISEEPDEPAFEVLAPEGPKVSRRAWIRGTMLFLLFVSLVLLGVLWWGRRPPGYAQEVAFAVEPEGAKAELLLLSAPEGSEFRRGARFSIPGKLRFDREGVYTFEVQSPGYRPKTFALEVPVLGGRVTVRLSGR